MEKEKLKRNYGLPTAISMIIGICIGSGIFFKSDNILVATGGSVVLGVVVFCLAATSIIFGGLCFGELASRTDRPGGLITYMEEFTNRKLACGMGWFQIFIYYPTIAVVVSWVVGIYICLLFGLNGSLENQMLIGFLFFTADYVFNTVTAKGGGAFQNFTTVAKLFPLFAIAVFGLIFGNPAEGLRQMSPQAVKGASWLAAIGPIAFSFDGWVISTSIAPEIRNSKKNLPRALVLAPIFILLTYVAYFIGVTSLLGTKEVLRLQDAHVYEAAQRLFGGFGGKLILVFVILSVMGTVNGVILGYIRLPYAMALRGKGMFPLSGSLSSLDKKRGMPACSAVFCYVLTLIWAAIHFLTVKYNLLPNSDISEIAIIMSYLFYIILYYKVFALYREGQIRSIFRGIVVPLLATLGSLFILMGGLQSRLFLFYAAFCILVVLLAFLYYHLHNRAAAGTENLS